MSPVRCFVSPASFVQHSFTLVPKLSCPPLIIRALKSGKIAGAALDAFCQEPLPKDHPFWKMKNVIVTPHVGGMSDIYVEQALSIFEENLQRYLKGERQNLINLVNW